MQSRNTEKTALLNTGQGVSIHQRAKQLVGRLPAATHRAINKPVKAIEPKVKAINEAMSYADPVIYPIMGLGVYDYITNNAAGWPDEYRSIADVADIAILPYLLLSFGLTAAYLNRNPEKHSFKNKSIAIAFFVLNNFHNAISAASFTEDTAFALNLDQTDPNGSTPSNSNIDVFYNVLAGSAAVGLVLGLMNFGEDYIREYERDGKVFLQKLRAQFNDTSKTAAQYGYRFARTALFGSQFNGGTINQAAVDIKQYWLKQSLITMPAMQRTALFIGGHAAGLFIEMLMLPVESEPMKELVERFFLILAGAFFLEEYFSDLAISVNDCNPMDSNDCERIGKPLKITGTALALLVLLTGTVILGIQKYSQKTKQQEMKAEDYRGSVNGDSAPDAVNDAQFSKKSTSSSDALPVDAESALINSPSSVSTSVRVPTPLADKRALSAASSPLLANSMFSEQPMTPEKASLNDANESVYTFNNE